MELYLASKFSLAARVDALHKVLEAAGHTVPDQWWRLDTKQTLSDGTNVEKMPDREWYKLPEVRVIADRHWQSIKRCDALVLVGPLRGGTPVTFTGAHIELGYAFALGKPCFTVGPLTRSAMYLPAVQCETGDELLRRLRLYAQFGVR